MTRRAAPIVLAKGLAVGLATSLTLSGCVGFDYISKNYVPLTPQVVSIGCNEPYEVYDNRQRRRMLVVSNALREVAGCGVGERNERLPPSESRAERFRAAARAYLDETVREDCRITGESVFGDLQTEFVYSCAEPIEPRGTKVPRLPGRGRVGTI